MHDDRRLIEGRLRRTLQRIEDAVWSHPVPVDLGRWDAPGEPVPVAEGLAAPYASARVGEPWGPPWGTTWWRVRGEVPVEHAGRPVDLRLDLGFDPLRTGFHVEGLVYRADGTPMKGLNPRNQWVRVSDAGAGEAVDLFVESASNPLLLGGGGFDFRPSPLGDPETAGREPMYRVVRAELAVFEQEVWELQQDLEVLGQLAFELDAHDPRQWQLLRAVDRALDRLDTADIAGTASAARGELEGVLSDPARASAHRISAVGHAHIDSAWLWPVRETVRKVARTCSNVLALMEDDPDLVYAMSSAQQFAWLRDHRPEVWTGVVERVREGRFVPVGGMWVESDTNMPGGEALARQLNHGKRFFLDELGIETREVWLPDSFGYTAALPQLIALSGSQWFLTQKISWNTTNRFPHHSFRWEGLDGTRVFTHFPPADTYGSEVSGAEVAHASRNFSDKGDATRSLLPFGWGDGGGGPTREMLARAKRLRDLDGSARIEVERPDAFFQKAEAEYPGAPVWVGELYLEMHRGTYTSQAKTKQGNRRSEHLLREAELWASTATVRTGAPYPVEELDRIWKVVLLQQFHDILPGSSIGWVHREAVAAYEAVAQELTAIIDAAQAALAGDGEAEVVFNASPDPRAGVPALGAGPRSSSGDATDPVTVEADGHGWVLSNGLVTARVDDHGLLTSVVDMASGREALAPGSAGNLLQLHPDTPVDFDAWDVDAYYRRTWTDLTDAESVEPVEDGVRVVRRFGDSTVTQLLTLTSGEARVDVGTEVDWREREKILKAGFDLDVTTERSTSEVQFGHVHRPTHTNTSWDAAKFEICAHRWVHVGEPGYGAAVVNDSTYGHDVSRRDREGGGTTTQVRLSLLRAPQSPDPVADLGVHRLRYAVVPGAGIADAIREGYRVNLPLRVVRGSGEVVEPLVSVDGGGVVVEAVKLADDGSGDVVVRLYESLGARSSAIVSAGFEFDGVEAVDLLERPLETAGVERVEGGVRLALRPFQVVTLRFARG
ncbi:glycoside hydrolase family 38 C-terminal domain-containing protein [Phycicoccus sp. Soil748]|uniref:glycoside hydrolase family 38 N-terminal domain-containing protein n=1 Tax=Phycicoccus sp. Soil748 TaxID=1736397 RepID=UPI000702A4A4|nr:glycoside hydrolase family 38 C-terminal domain-containing protein [Phycicoccus sp. Soil748]KRE58955.1 alpha-mannosidase [Phycicoccus sp. Soil748]